ncbi:Mus81p NDAI_0A04370 [Naumovozyma dairenensis CBS 421]|uniref:Crossover junction endonuclease MUS81 n=1 Tax=Naumovozyma dairenensis (strain ATCC 10597 / BCRC 20456 / CBS 421 / NBRC 0211 / NRRL Y-12639) TaxID=1071378 RepID=G0W456_NAUDC|nr:hypothetical protein NDAI_0A04370 [Naumovozyma dairenensis CBS 421]CCD22594.1 hypothetical protein NDAI_0A04370 [Naumovozyma dairenensis CBS 421]
MCLPDNLKDLYLKFLQELIDGLSSRQEQLSLTYDKAKRNLKETDGIFYYPKDLKKVKGIGDTIITRLEKKLHEHCEDLGITPPESRAPARNTRVIKRTTTLLRTESQDGILCEEPEKKKTKRAYIPKKKSGGYAILLVLLEYNAINRGLTKDIIVENAQKYATHSMNGNFATKNFHGAWSSISSLKKHNLVLESGRPKVYTLTEEGATLANTLKVADKIIFDKEMRNSGKSADSSFRTDDEKSANLSDLLSKEKILHRSADTFHSSSFLDYTFQEQLISTRPTAQRMHTLAVSSPASEQHNMVPVPRNTSAISTSRTSALRRRYNGISYEIWPKGNYEIYPIIDHREVKSQKDREFFSNTFATKGLKNEIQQLALGDILWVAKNKKTGRQCVLNTIVERKRLDDLAVSIKDNRFMEQKNRLEKSGCTHKYYLIEETMGNNIGNMGEALKTALWLILVYYRFSMIRTLDSDETVESIITLNTIVEHFYSKKDILVIFPHSVENQNDFKKTLDMFKEEFERKGNIACCHNFVSFQEVMGKSDMKTVGELTIIVLMYIKGVSLEKALAIQSFFPTLNHILQGYRKCRSPGEAKLLMFTKLGDAPGTKKITKSLSEKISDVFSTL